MEQLKILEELLRRKYEKWSHELKIMALEQEMKEIEIKCKENNISNYIKNIVLWDDSVSDTAGNILYQHEVYIK